MPTARRKPAANGGVTVGSITRSIRGITLGSLQAYQDKRVRDWEGAKDEYDQQFQVPVSATIVPFPNAGSTGTNTPQITRDMMQAKIHVDFDVNFLYEPNERANGLTVPHFTYGVEFKSGTPCLLTAMVSAWSGGGVDGYAGADVILVVGFPGSRKQMQFNGIVHLNFQGYAMPTYAGEPETISEDEDE